MVSFVLMGVDSWLVLIEPTSLYCAAFCRSETNGRLSRACFSFYSLAVLGDLSLGETLALVLIPSGDLIGVKFSD